jgi:alpha-beta hydrolase superfamily lysophospholipase
MWQTSRNRTSTLASSERQSLQETEIQLDTADGLGLFAKEWRPDGPTRGVVCVFHGLGEHGGQYVEVAKALTEAGVALIAIDLRGHGRSPGRRGHTPSYGALLDDVDALLAGAAERHPGAPRFLYGQSLGGNLVLNHAIRRQPDIVGVIATGPWLRMTNDLVWYKRFLATILEPIWPTLSFSTGDDEILEETGVRRDVDLFHRLISLRLLMGMRRAGVWAERNASLLRTPALLIHGEADPVTSPDASLEFARGAGTICQATFLSGIGHNPHEENPSTIPMIVGWVLGRIPTP